jgi:hypothetical protein
MKKIKEQLKEEFLEKMKRVPVMVKGHNWSMTIEEYEEQESYKRSKFPIDRTIH